MIEDLPFDLKSTRIVPFNLNNVDSTSNSLAKVLTEMVEEIKKRDKTKLLNYENSLKNEILKVRDFLKLFNRRVFHAPLNQENAVEMYDAINSVRIVIQEKGLHLEISDFEVRNAAKAILDDLNKAITQVRENSPEIEQLANKIEIPSIDKIMEEKLISYNAYGEAIRTLNGIRNHLSYKIKIIREYYDNLQKKKNNA